MSSNQFIFSLQDLSKSWPGGKTLFENINLSFLPNAKIGIVGVNGSGKSTLLKILSGIDKEFNGEIIADKTTKIGYLPQEPELDSSKSVFENISIALKDKIDLLNKYNELSMNYSEEIADDLSKLQEEIESKDLWNLDSKIEQAMQALRCPEKEKDVSLLSGGEKRRVAICKLLLEEPDLLLLDEPTNHLDPETVAWLENYLIAYKGTVILITHDRFFLDNITQWILELDRGKAIPYEGNYSKWLIQKKKRVELEVKHENARLRRLKNEVEWISSSPKARQTKSKARIDNYEALLNSKNIQSIDDPQIIIPNAPRLGDLVLEIGNLKKIIEDKILIEKLSFKMPKGAIVGVIGANGVGKTTLFNIISDNLEPSEGTVRLGDTVNLGYVNQSRESLDNSKTVWEEISEGNDVVEINSTTINTRAYTSSFNFKGTDQQKKIGQLSGGERNRVHLAKVLKSGANVILLDEPTNDLDVETLHALEYAIEKFSGCVMIISHDRWFLDRICTHILAFEGNSHVEWFEGNYLDYVEDRKNRFGEENEIPSNIKYKKFSR
ncbi:MAG: energy-dependent translational throttle protein EttA [Rhodobiaceae bacterium]|mgnify:FL=1|nr:energy-dependent translational throttle protein EttA [Rhodobiaceae bacterium]|tara:strand:- start:878 stop:2533 length:1656 start_codon:yes stop_codon:yes gene_type:complete